MEGAELALFMISACAFGTALWYRNSWAVRLIPSQIVRLCLMGLAMGVTAVLIILSPWGRRSGAHFNPAITITFYLLGKIKALDALLYVIAQFIGAVVGVMLARLVLGAALTQSPVTYVVTVPGRFGTAAAFGAEYFMGALTMIVVLSSNLNRTSSRFTWLLVGLLVTSYVIIFSPVSGFSINPARTFGSALAANVWTGLWIYFTAPLLGMITSAQLFALLWGRHSIMCAKVYHDPHSECPFICHYRG